MADLIPYNFNSERLSEMYEEFETILENPKYSGLSKAEISGLISAFNHNFIQQWMNPDEDS